MAGDAPTTYELYDTLDPLPLPRLEDTLTRYLDSIEPLVDPDTYARAKASAAALAEPGGLGPRLQAALAEKAARSDNWLAEWWDDVAYLAYPEPVHINSNFGINADVRQAPQDPARRAAVVAARTIDYALSLFSESAPPETAGRARTPLDMSFFRRIFATIREPGAERDRIVTYDPDMAQHLLVIRRGRFYVFDAIGAAGRTLTVADLAHQFERVIALADAEAERDGPAAPVAALTAERRPVWAMERARLMADPINARSLGLIERALFVVCFEDAAFTDQNAMVRNNLVGAPGARWHDKTFAWVIDAEGRVSQHGEHSTSDGMQHISIIDHAAGPASAEDEAEAAQPPRADLPGPQQLDWRLSPESRAAIAAATALFEARGADVDQHVLRFERFGKGAIKPLGTGPDSFVQMGFQLAFHRLHGRTPKTYESSQTRAFRLGRTETIRSASTESRAFTIAWDDAETPEAEKAHLLRAAVSVHGQRGKEAAQGQGCDRHLLGLALTAREIGAPAPALLEDEVYKRGWELSTAQLPMQALLVNAFGPVTHEGYGIGYVIREDFITCHISSWRSHPDTSSERFAEALEAAIVEMRELLSAHPA